MNITLNMEFTSVDELQQFLSGRAGQPSTAGVGAAVAIATPAAVAAIDIPAIDIPAAVDVAALRTDLMTRLRAAAEALDDPSPIGAFVNGFGISRFSELPDEQLQAFSSKFAATFEL